MKEYEEKLLKCYVPVAMICDCCKKRYEVNYSWYDRDSSKGFAILRGEDEAGFGTHKYEEIACSYDCTFHLAKKHMSPIVEFPYEFISERLK